MTVRTLELEVLPVQGVAGRLVVVEVMDFFPIVFCVAFGALIEIAHFVGFMTAKLMNVIVACEAICF